jgi:soluble P-type ATPase
LRNGRLLSNFKGELKSVFTPSLINNSVYQFLKHIEISNIFPEEKDLGSKMKEFGHPMIIRTEYGKIDELQVYGVNPKNQLRQRTSIVVANRNSSSNYFFLLVRGEQHAMKGTFNMPEVDMNVYRNLMASYKDKRLTRIVYAYRRLSKEEVKNYVEQYSVIVKAKKYEIESINRVALPLEKNLKFLGAIGLKAKVRKEAVKLVENLRAAYIKVSILSGDTYENTVNVARELGLPPYNISDTSSYFNLSIDSQARTKNDLNSYLEIIYHLLKSSNYQALNVALGNIVKDKEENVQAHQILQELSSTAEKGRVDFKFKRPMILSGKSLCFIQSSSELEEIFKIILVFTSSVIGHDLLPSQKAWITKSIRKQDDVILAVGDGLNDIGMFNEAHVGVQLINDDSNTFIGDIIINRLDILSSLIFDTGFNLFKNIKSILYVLIWHTTKFAVANFWVYIRTDFSTRFFDPYMIHIIALLPIVECIYVAIVHDPYPKEFIANNLAVYQEHNIFSARITLVASIFFACVIFEVFLTFFIAHFFFSPEMLESGFSGGYHMTYMYIITSFIVNCVQSNYFFWTFRQQNKFIAAIGMTIIGALLYTYYFLVDIKSPEKYFSMTSVLSTVPLVTCYIIASMVSLYFNFIFLMVLKFKAIHPVQGLITQLLQKAYDWKSHVDNRNPIIANFMKSYVEYNHTSDKLVDKVADIVKPRTQKKVEPNIMKIILLNVYNFNIGFEQFRNKILDFREHMKFSVFNVKSHFKFTLFIFKLEIIFYSLEALLKLSTMIAKKDGWNALYRHNFLHKIAAYGILVWLINRVKARDLDLYKVIIYGQISTLVIDLILLLLDIFLPYHSLDIWHNLNLNNRLLSSSIPIDFTHSFILLSLFSLIKIYKSLFMKNPIIQYISSPISIVVLLLNILLLLGLKLSLKKKYDQNIKINFLSVNRMKTEINKSREKLAMLMPQFVWDKINTEGFSSNLFLNSR